MRVFVTGATGMLGANLVLQLIKDGHQVSALARNPKKAESNLPAGIETVMGDLQDVAAFSERLRGCQVVVHCAAYFREYYGGGEHAQNLERLNVEGTLQLLDAALQAGVERFVHISSSGTVGHRADGLPGDEDTPASAWNLANLYFRSKVEADRRIAACKHHDELRIISVLPGWMFAPKDSGPTAAGQLVLDFLAGKLPAVPPGGTTVVDARDVAIAISKLLTHPNPQSRYIVAGRLTTLRQLVDGLSRVSGKAAPRWNIPYWLAMVIAYLAESWSKLTGGKSVMTREGIKTVASLHSVSSARAQKDLQIEFRPLDDTLRDCVEWIRAS